MVQVVFEYGHGTRLRHSELANQGDQLIGLAGHVLTQPAEPRKRVLDVGGQL